MSGTTQKMDHPHGSPAVTRRHLLAAAGLGTAWLGSAGCSELKTRLRAVTGPEPAHWTADRAVLTLPGATQATLVLNRAAYGPRPGEVAQVAHQGAAGYLEEQLADKIDEDPAVTWRVGGLEVQQDEQDAPDVLDSLNDDQLLNETQQAMLLRAIYSRHQLREVMADFWTNHFNIYALKNHGRELIPTDAERVIRPHALGRFHDLLSASAHSPAMLAYLDNNQNRRGSGDAVNENYARELLELHTLGVHSGYTQRDIHEVARAFTGWTVADGFFQGEYRYEPQRHDEGAKFIPFLNLRLDPHRGQKDAETVLEALAVHPATARFLARKLCLRLLGTIPEPIAAQAAASYLRSGTDIRALLRPILLDGLLGQGCTKPILKRPLDFAVSSLRALAADTDGSANLQKYLADMGQPLYQWPMPDGFPQKTGAWTGAMLPRWNFALALASSTISGTAVDLQAPLKAAKATTDRARLDTLISAILNRSADAPELARLRAGLRAHVDRAHREGGTEPVILAEVAGLLLASPQFQWI